jgi:hypothetical protein
MWEANPVKQLLAVAILMATAHCGGKVYSNESAGVDATGPDAASGTKEVAPDDGAASQGDAGLPADATTPEGDAMLSLTDVEVTAVPGNPLACRVKWATSLPADAVVSFGVGNFTTRARSPGQGLQHEVLVYGLRAESAYRLLPRSTTAQGKTATGAEQQFITGPLPSGVAPATVDIPANKVGPIEWVLASVHLGLPANGASFGFPAAAVAYDSQGYPVWFLQLPKSNIALARWRPAGQVMVLADELAGVFDLTGTAVWLWPSTFDLKGGGVLASPQDGMPHHDMRILTGDRVLQVQFEVRDGALGDRVVELDAQQNKLWSWSTLDHLDAGEWPGLNSAVLVAGETQVLVSSRTFSRVYCIQRSTGKVLWAAGNGGTLALESGSDASWFALQHDAQLLPNGHLLVYDNGLPQRGYSRAVEYALDLTAGTAKQVWQAKGAPDNLWYSGGEGSVERWDDGRTLLAAPDFQKGFPARSRLIVVDAAGQIGWQVRLAKLGGEPAFAYRAVRMLPPNLEPMASGDVP